VVYLSGWWWGKRSPFERMQGRSRRYPLLNLFSKGRTRERLRDKSVSPVLARTGLEFTGALESYDLILSATVCACRSSEEEFSEGKCKGLSDTVKHPLCQSLQASRGEANWVLIS
jgi:hypothetical protein